MKKVGIITLNGYFNYGNRLQNYALQEVLKSLGFNVETIIYNTNEGNILTRKEKVQKIFEKLSKLKNYSFNDILDKSVNVYMHKKNAKEDTERTKIFKNFSKNYINETDYFISKNNIPNDLNERYDFFVTGSDQVWNPDSPGEKAIYFLNFADKKKRIAYSPSFGTSEISSEYEENYRNWISDFYRLSVRESDGAKIIKELTGREAPVLVDPTLLLTKEKWLSIAKRAKNKPKRKYLLTYFLGRCPKDYKTQIKEIAKKNNLEIINLGEIREKETYKTGPSEFIDYINSCEIMCTDSFHGTVFSILFEKPFIIYKRKETTVSMYSRIETLLNTFNLKNREFSYFSNTKDYKTVFNIDYSHVDNILEKERKRSFDYLKEALDRV